MLLFLLICAGVTYFFRGQHYWEFNDLRMEVRHDRRHLGVDWLGCEIDPNEQGPNASESPSKTSKEGGGADVGLIIGIVVFLVILVLIVVIVIVVCYKCFRSKRYRYGGSKFSPVKT